jgi:ribosomal protein S27AE
VPKSKESNKKRSESHKGKPHDYQKGEKNQCFTQMKNGNHPSQIKKTCPHCGATVSSNIFAQWHGDNCIKVKERVSPEKKKCPHCGILAAPSQYTRYHGDNCIKMKERVPLVKKECPHCGTYSAASQYTLYHGDKCKKNKNSVIQIDELAN